ncbi:MAG: hypothetical protein KKH08_00970 [Candidatus Omnitrophica bacterium]|nr:hypothetical protein [Candidatus Omnitrophota bacterium]
MMLNAFILTTLDTPTRICRYLSEELFKIKNRFFATFVVIFTSAALTFIVVSSWLLCRRLKCRIP